MASGVTREDFRREFPEFPSGVISDERLDRLLERASRFHTHKKEGTLYAAAHLFCLDRASGKAVDIPNPQMGQPTIGTGEPVADGGLGVVKKETIGPKTIEYKTNADENPRHAFWATSTYGREFLLIEQRNVRQGFGMLIA